MRCVRTSRSVFHAPVTVYVIVVSLLMVCLCAGVNGNAQVMYPPYLNQFSGFSYSLNASPFAWQNNNVNRAFQFSSLFNTYQFNQPFQNQYSFSYPMTYSFGYNPGLQGYAGPYAGNRPYASFAPSFMNAYAFAPSSPFAYSFAPGFGAYTPWNYFHATPSGPIYTPEPVQPQARAKEYLAVIPKELHAGEDEQVSITLFEEGSLTRRRGTHRVALTLSKEGEEILETVEYISGKGSIQFTVPEVEEGEYDLTLKGDDFEGGTTVSVVDEALLFVQTDKPIYQPGQTIRMRVISLDTALRPVSRAAVVEVNDAKGIKIFRKQVATDEYGMALLDLPISTEPNLGVWKIVAVCENADTQLDVRVERYVLPKYEVTPELSREWFLVDEPVTGTVKAEYSFGKPVRGDLVIEAKRYVGEWQVFETFTTEIDGETTFEIPAVGYVAGVPAAGGMGNITLDFTVKERNTNYQEKTNRLVTISSSPLLLQVIPEGSVFMPGLPFNLLIVTTTPDNAPVDAQVTVKITYIDSSLNTMSQRVDTTVTTAGGKAPLTITPPAGCVALVCNAESGDASLSKPVEAGYSPSGNFIHLEQISQGIPRVGESIRFKVHATNEAFNFYYEVVARNRVVFSDNTELREISFVVTPAMAPSAKILVYQILPTSEVAADYLPFDVTADYPHQVTATFDSEEVRPGDDISIAIQTEGNARVGIAAVDRSVFILAENRLNLQQVFAELERLYMEPQAELHSSSVYNEVYSKGAQDIFEDAGVIVLSSKDVPQGKGYERFWRWPVLWGGGPFFAFNAAPSADSANDGLKSEPQSTFDTGNLAQVEKVRQFFPETWLWEDLVTDSQGKGSIDAQAPDTITTWKLQAVAISPQKGFGIGEDDLRVFQPFFISVDLPYSAIRGEEFPVKVAVYNYLDTPQEVLVEIEEADWFTLLEGSSKVVTVGANDIGGAQFMIRPLLLGQKKVEVSARSSGEADAVLKGITIIPEGVERDSVENLVLKAGESKTFDTSVPPFVVEGSGRASVAATASYLTQTIEGLEKLLKMPFGCGEQNMIFLAPDICITRYLRQTGQLKPEIMAKAEMLMITGYQRQLTYRRNDGSFSAFGNSDQEGSLWLTSFVLKVFSQARDIMYIDENVLKDAKDWIRAHQNADGSFDPVGFVHHKEMIGGLKGKTALTAFAAIALKTAGDTSGASAAAGYLEEMLSEINGAYSMTLVAYALELCESSLRDAAYAKLLEFANTEGEGLYWSAGCASIEATAYAMLALMEHGDRLNAGLAAKWLVTQRNPFGGFNSTQDTVVAMDALTTYSEYVQSEVDLTLTITTGSGTDAAQMQITIGGENFDVLQVVEVPVNQQVTIAASGMGEAVVQFVKRYNVPQPDQAGQVFAITVDYDTAEVEVNDLVTVSVEVMFTPSTPIEAGMVVLDISVPTGFAPVGQTLDDLVEDIGKIKRYEVAGRKVIFYIENMIPNEVLSFGFQVKALYPVKAKGVTSQAYSYYDPDMKGETMSGEMTVLAK